MDGVIVSIHASDLEHMGPINEKLGKWLWVNED